MDFARLPACRVLCRRINTVVVEEKEKWKLQRRLVPTGPVSQRLLYLFLPFSFQKHYNQAVHTPHEHTLTRTRALLSQVTLSPTAFDFHFSV